MIKLQKMIGVIERCNIRYKTNAFLDLGLSGCNYIYLFVLNRMGSLCLDELVKELHINKSNVTRGIQSLVEKEFVVVNIDEEDKRVKRVCLTDKGREVIPIIIERIRKWNSVLLEGFNQEEEEILNEMLIRLMNNAIRNDLINEDI